MAAKGNRGAGTSKFRRALWWSILGLCVAILGVCGFLVARFLPLAPRDSRQIVVPALEGSVLADGDGQIDETLFDVTFVYRQDAGSAPGTVLRQSPAAGAMRRVIPGRAKCALRLTVSTGADSLTLPDLTGTDARETTLMLRSHGVRVRTETVTRPDLSDGQVVETSPAAGTTVHAGEAVTLRVSRPATVRTVKVPDTVGMQLPYANAAMVLRGLRPGEAETCVSPLPAGTVISQRPLAGTTVPAGTQATLIVSDGSAPALPEGNRGGASGEPRDDGGKPSDGQGQETHSAGETEE